MKLIINSALIFFITTQPAFATNIECNDLIRQSQNSIIFLDKTELLQLGQCTGVQVLNKYSGHPKLASSCREITENNRNLLGFAQLSSTEIIQIGQCLGVINYIFEKYHNNSMHVKRYHCSRGEYAAKIIGQQIEQPFHRIDVKKLLCK